MTANSTAGIPDIRITEAARALGRTPATVRDHCRRGNLRRTRKGYVRLDDVRALAERTKHFVKSQGQEDFETRLREINLDLETRLNRLSRAFGLYARTDTQKTDRLVNMIRLHIRKTDERLQRMENDLRELKRRHGIVT